GHWGLTYARDLMNAADLDPRVLMWSMRKRADLDVLPDWQMVLQFGFSGVPANRVKYVTSWLLLESHSAEIARNRQALPVYLTVRGKMQDCVALCFGEVVWREVAGTRITIEGDAQLVAKLPTWLRLEQVFGRDLPFIAAA